MAFLELRYCDSRVLGTTIRSRGIRTMVRVNLMGTTTAEVADLDRN